MFRNKLKVLFCIDGLNIGGKEKRLLLLIKHLNPKIFDLILVKFEDYDELLEDFRLHIKKIITCKRYFRWDPTMFYKLYNILNTHSPNMIIAFDWMTAFYTMPVSKLLDIPFINASITDASMVNNYKKKIKKFILHRSEYVVSNSKSGLLAYDLTESNNIMIII